jgi:hypothetical protein
MSASQGIMDSICESTMEEDGGLFCPRDCENAGPLPIIEVNAQERALVGECPEHGKFTVDVTAEYDELLIEQAEDEQYQLGDAELGMLGDLEREEG